MKKDILIGIIIGLLANTIGVLIFSFYIGTTQDRTLTNVLQTALAEGRLGKIIAIGAVLNLVAFFGLLRQGQDARARGVLLMTIAMAFVTMILMFS
ncbi:hypothetical protein [Dokdonia donghaensis]|uniref:Membrane protein n=1 Tax=Dokdonia donghaensis DSW-1 TaxID=1300343 RepID=A0A0A2H1C8_9FLAO|nr:hypothetical protein [Dokdonia donghaensis]ANH59023.1 hypothetical protein I597_0087 [Dokdonia donghaensis DSW-1]KGO06455.1 membrane protein [Dokdonia donghaensis DSW-1]